MGMSSVTRRSPHCARRCASTARISWIEPTRLVAPSARSAHQRVLGGTEQAIARVAYHDVNAAERGEAPFDDGTHAAVSVTSSSSISNLSGYCLTRSATVCGRRTVPTTQSPRREGAW